MGRVVRVRIIAHRTLPSSEPGPCDRRLLPHWYARSACFWVIAHRMLQFLLQTPRGSAPHIRSSRRRRGQTARPPSDRVLGTYQSDLTTPFTDGRAGSASATLDQLICTAIVSVKHCLFLIADDVPGAMPRSGEFHRLDQLMHPPRSYSPPSLRTCSSAVSELGTDDVTLACFDRKRDDDAHRVSCARRASCVY